MKLFLLFSCLLFLFAGVPKPVEAAIESSFSEDQVSPEITSELNNLYDCGRLLTESGIQKEMLSQKEVLYDFKYQIFKRDYHFELLRFSNLIGTRFIQIQKSIWTASYLTPYRSCKSRVC